MGIVSTVKEALQASSQTTNRGDGKGNAAGAYWCHDCNERIPAGDVDGDDAPACPECGDEMTLERSPGSTGCAC